jgi:hypothetical protein
LKGENAAFRVVTEAGLRSASIDHFDSLLLEQATEDWQRQARLIGFALAYDFERYFQSSDLMLHARVVALVEAGKLIAEGDPWDITSRVRLPG